MGALHTHPCPECYRHWDCRQDCTTEPPEAHPPMEYKMEHETLPKGTHELCDACRLPAPAGPAGPVFQEGMRVFAMDTGYVYEIEDVCKSGRTLQNTSRPILRAELVSAVGYPNHERTVYLDADGTPLRHWDGATTWEHARKP